MNKIVIFLLLSVQWCYTQKNKAKPQNGVQLVDHHHTNITDVLQVPLNNTYYSSDTKGKIICYNATTNKYKYTYQEADGIGVKKMQLINNNRLLVTKAYATLDGTRSDSLFGYDIPYKKKVLAKKIDANMLGLDADNYMAFSFSEKYNHGITLMKRNPFQVINTFKTTKPVLSISVSKDGQTIAYTQAQFGVIEFKIQSLDGSTLYTETLDGTDIDIDCKAIYESSGSVLLVMGKTDKKKITAYRYNTNYKKEKVLEVENVFGQNLFLESVKKHNKTEFILNYGSNLIIRGIEESGIYKLNTLKPKGGGSFKYSYLPLTSNNFITYQSQLNSSKGIYNRISSNKTESKSIDNITSYGNYKAQFLASGDIIFTGNSKNEKQEIKLFTKGTLHNKFAPLSARDYLNRYAKLNIYDYSFVDEQIDPLSSSIAFRGRYKEDKGIFSYNFSTEKVSKLSEDVADGISSIVSFHGKTSQAILSKGNYKHGGGHIKPTPLKHCISGNCKIIDGAYKQAQFSRDGKYLLTVNDKNLIQLRALPNLKVLTDKQIEGKPNIELNYSDNNEFEIELDYIYKPNACHLKHLSLTITGTNYKFQEKDCLGVIDSDFQNDKLVVLLQYLGIYVENEILSIDKSKEPNAISLNSDASKFLVSYKHGLTEMYDVASKEKELSIVHPNYNSHLFINNDGYYTTNFEINNLVIGYENGVTTPLNTLKNKYDKPTKILKKIGFVNENYAQTLAKAEKIRSSFTNETNTNTTIHISDFKLKNSSSNTTNNLINTFTFQSKELVKNKVSVYLNDVEVQEAKVTTSTPNKYQFKIELADVKNKIELRTETGTIAASQEVIYNGKELNPKLFVLAIGVSNYQQNKHNLTFAAKDAIDIAKLYGELTKEEISNYQNEYFGDPLYLTNNIGKTIAKPCVYYNESDYNFSSFTPITYDGSKWLKRGTEKEAFIYDFKTGKRTPFNFINSSFLNNIEFIPNPNGDGFITYYNNEWLSYNFKNKLLTQIKAPININSEFYHHLLNNKWLQVNTVNKRDKENGQYIESLKFSVTKNNEILESHIIDLYDTYNPQVKAVSNNGKYILLQTTSYNTEGEKDIFHLYDLKEKEPYLITKKVFKKGEITVTDRLYITGNDIPTIYQIKHSFGKGTDKNKLIIYNKKLDIITNKNLDLSLNYGKLNLVVGSNGPIYLNRKKSTAINKDIFNKSISDLVKNNSATAASFIDTEASYLVNKNATKANIIKELKALKDKAKPQDQIIVFLAGHGVLDKDLNYYYAPNDMDFENVKNKGVSFNQIISGLNDTKSTKMLLLMDTCHSGNTLDMDNYEISESASKDKNGNKHRGGIAVKTGNKGNPIKVSQVVNTLFDNFTSTSGITVLSASSGQDVAYESKELSNGAFTTAYITHLQELLGKNFINNADYTKPLNLSDDFIKQLRNRILDHTNNKQQLDIREINKLSKIKLW